MVKPAAMFALPVIEADRQRAANFLRRPAYSGEPIERHLRLNEDQLDHVVGLYQGWREQQAGGNGQPRPQTSMKRMQTFLHYLASGGFHRQIGFSFFHGACDWQMANTQMNQLCVHV